MAIRARTRVDAVASRGDAGLRVDVGGGDVLGLCRAVGDGAERRELGEHAVELVGGHADGEPRLVQTDRGPAALRAVAGIHSPSVCGMPSGSLPEVNAHPPGSAAVTTLSLSTVPPAPEAMRRARPAAPARSLTSRPIDAVRTIFVVVASAAAASDGDGGGAGLGPSGGIGGRCDRVASLGGRGRTGVALEKAREPRRPWSPRSSRGHRRRGGRGRSARRGPALRRRRARGRASAHPGHPGRVVDHARSGARVGLRSECRCLLSERSMTPRDRRLRWSCCRGSSCSSWSSSGVPLAGARWALLSHRSDQQTPGGPRTLQECAPGAGVR